MKLLIQTVSFFFLTLLLSSLDFPERPVGSHFVIDYDNLLSYTDQLELEGMLENFKDSSGINLLLVTIPVEKGISMIDFANQLAKKWEATGEMLPKSVLFAVDKNGRVGIATGSKFKGSIPESVSETLERDILRPGFESDNKEPVIKKATLVMMGILTGDPSDDNFLNSYSFLLFLFMTLLGLFFLFVYPMLSYKTVKKGYFATRPIGLFAALSLKHNFGTSNINGFEEFSTGRGPFGGRTHDEMMDTLRHGGGIGGKW